MKKIALGLLVISLTTTYTVMGQNINNDPTYSVNNYKHPNKAKEAKEINKDKTVCFKSGPKFAFGNYKQQNNITTPAKEELNYSKKEGDYNALTNPENYKIHH